MAKTQLTIQWQSVFNQPFTLDVKVDDKLVDSLLAERYASTSITISKEDAFVAECSVTSSLKTYTYQIPVSDGECKSVRLVLHLDVGILPESDWFDLEPQG